MIKVICGGKKNSGWTGDGINEYEKRLKKPFNVEFECYEEEKLAKFLEKWPFSGKDYVILCDERGENISSIDFSQKLEKCFMNSKNVVVVVGGAFGVTNEVREKADFVWSFSKLVFPHMLFRLMLTEQIYRAMEIANGGKYHHE